VHPPDAEEKRGETREGGDSGRQEGVCVKLVLRLWGGWGGGGGGGAWLEEGRKQSGEQMSSLGGLSNNELG